MSVDKSVLLQAKVLAGSPSQRTAEVISVKLCNERWDRGIHDSMAVGRCLLIVSPTVEFSFCSRTVSASKSWSEDPPEDAGMLNAGAYRAE